MPGARHLRVTWSAAARCLAAGVLALLVFTAQRPVGALAAGPIVPDSSCADESTYKSLKGDTTAVLQVINKSPIDVDVYWLDYSGKRVLYQKLPAFTMYDQRTWLTHPWVITNLSGQCLRFLVMTSQLQAVTVEGEPPDPDTTALPLSARATAPPTPEVTIAPTVVPTAAPTPAGTPEAVATPVPTTATPQASTSGSGGGGLVVVAVIAAVVVVAGGAAAATGRLPGFRGRGRGAG